MARPKQSHNKAKEKFVREALKELTPSKRRRIPAELSEIKARAGKPPKPPKRKPKLAPLPKSAPRPKTKSKRQGKK